MPFVTKTDLPTPTIERLEAINALSSGLRTAADAAFLAARLQYLTNEVLLRDENNLIVIAAGNTVPTSVDGFKVGALFVNLTNSVVYTNTGDDTSATWDTRDSVDEDTPVNSVKATQTITSDATAPDDGDEIVIGAITYTARTALTTDPATVPYEVLIGASAAAFLDNLKSAINATAGAGTTYSTGTVAHPLVIATTNTNTTQVIEAIDGGEAGNLIGTSETSDHLSWGDTEMAGGIDGTPGVKGAMLFDEDNVYLAIQENTIEDAVWRKVAHSAL